MKSNFTLDKIIRTNEIDVLTKGVRFKIFCLLKHICCSLVFFSSETVKHKV